MKVRYSNNINAFGGVNFVLQEFDKLKIGNILYDNLPSLSPKSSYSWRDIFYSFQVFISVVETAWRMLRPFLLTNLEVIPYLTYVALTLYFVGWVILY
ncbi:MAG: hypothetical protein IPF52_14605 [Saprospiraceae bacterium]|nr:hypothetical protein [Saprospiraceae bacterium]